LKLKPNKMKNINNIESFVLGKLRTNLYPNERNELLVLYNLIKKYKKEIVVNLQIKEN